MVAKAAGPRKRPESGSASRPPNHPGDERAAPAGSAGEEPRPADAAEQPKPGDDINVLRGVAGATSRIVQQAASILEEEIAAGIVAAKRVEDRLIDVQKLRNGRTEEVMQRFRRDAHDVVDILIDLVNLTTNSLGGLAQRVVKIGGLDASGEKAGRMGGAAGGIPSLAVTQAVRPGEAAQVPIMLENESDSATESFQFISSDLINAAGDRIAAREISFAPAALAIGPHNSATVTVTVNVPVGTKVGVYSGLLQATKLEQLRAVLTVPIAG